jgi:hypothetical protein
LRKTTHRAPPSERYGEEEVERIAPGIELSAHDQIGEKYGHEEKHRGLGLHLGGEARGAHAAACSELEVIGKHSFGSELLSELALH